SSAPCGRAASPAAVHCAGAIRQWVRGPVRFEPVPVCLPRQSPGGAYDANTALGAGSAKTQFGRGEQAIHDHVIAAHPVVYELRGLALRAGDEQRRHLALGDTVREFDVDLAAVIEGVQRAPRRVVALDG